MSCPKTSTLKVVSEEELRRREDERRRRKCSGLSSQLGELNEKLLSDFRVEVHEPAQKRGIALGDASWRPGNAQLATI